MAGGGLGVVAEGGLQVGVVGEILLGIEIIGRTPLGRAEADEVPRPGVAIRPEGGDQIVVGGDVLQPVEADPAPLVRAVVAVVIIAFEAWIFSSRPCFFPYICLAVGAIISVIDGGKGRGGHGPEAALHLRPAALGLDPAGRDPAAEPELPCRDERAGGRAGDRAAQRHGAAERDRRVPGRGAQGRAAARDHPGLLPAAGGQGGGVRHQPRLVRTAAAAGDPVPRAPR